MSNLQVTLPDGSVQSVPASAAPIDVARSISPRLADDALVAKVNGNLWDLDRPLEADSTLQILTPKTPRTGLVEITGGVAASAAGADGVGEVLKAETPPALHFCQTHEQSPRPKSPAATGPAVGV